MSLIRVKTKFQVTLPVRLRERARLHVGDLLEAKIERGRITLTPKSVVDRGIDEGLADIKAGRFIGPFASKAEAMKALRAKARAPSPERSALGRQLF
jgi:bifunctional DNA-binding transcriptional regulator/antitoxin component of YhaV-PrlF toxin-antitoxin module